MASGMPPKLRGQPEDVSKAKHWGDIGLNEASDVCSTAKLCPDVRKQGLLSCNKGVVGSAFSI
jgi:hypothetical protein